MMEATSGDWPHDWLGALVDLGFEAMRPEEIYRTLHLMEEGGPIVSEKEESEFMLSQRRSGRAYLDFLAHSLEECRKEITLFFGAYERHPLPEVYG